MLNTLLMLATLLGGPDDMNPPAPAFAGTDPNPVMPDFDTPPTPTIRETRTSFRVAPPLTWTPGAPTPVIGYTELLDRLQRGERLSVGFGTPPCQIDGWTPVRVDNSIFQGCYRCHTPEGGIDPVMEPIVVQVPAQMPGPGVPVMAPFGPPPPAAQPPAASLVAGVRPAGLSNSTETTAVTNAGTSRPLERVLGWFGARTPTGRTTTSARGAGTGGDTNCLTGG